MLPIQAEEELHKVKTFNSVQNYECPSDTGLLNLAIDRISFRNGPGTIHLQKCTYN